MKKIKLISDKNLKCKNCGYFTLRKVIYASLHQIHVKCINCNADFVYSDKNMVIGMPDYK